jgi:hypothetical protein
MKKNKKAKIVEVKIPREQMKTWTVVSDSDGNDTFEIIAANQNDAAHEALNELGWFIAKRGN